MDTHLAKATFIQHVNSRDRLFTALPLAQKVKSRYRFYWQVVRSHDYSAIVGAIVESGFEPAKDRCFSIGELVEIAGLIVSCKSREICFDAANASIHNKIKEI